MMYTRSSSRHGLVQLLILFAVFILLLLANRAGGAVGVPDVQAQAVGSYVVVPIAHR